MAEAKPPPKREEKAPPREYYQKVGKESKAAIVGAVPAIARAQSRPIMTLSKGLVCM